jgi:hypothetical protein
MRVRLLKATPLALSRREHVVIRKSRVGLDGDCIVLGIQFVHTPHLNAGSVDQWCGCGVHCVMRCGALSKMLLFVPLRAETCSVLNSKLELLGLLPRERGVAKVSVLGGLAVDGAAEVKLAKDDTWAEVEVLLDDLEELLLADLASAVVVNVE